MKPGAIAHATNDSVAVSIGDLSAGTTVEVITLEGEALAPVVVATDIPLGHKVAVRAARSGSTVVKYGASIGVATKSIRPGDHVHTHNLRSMKWEMD